MLHWSMRLPRVIFALVVAAALLAGCGLDQYVAQTVKGLRAEDYFTDPTTQALATAVCDGEADEVKRLVGAGADPDARGTDDILPLQYGIRCDDLDGVQALIDAGADLDLVGENGWPVLHTAATAGHQDALDALLVAGADPEVRNPRTDSTTLTIAVNDQAAFDRLMLAKPDVDASSKGAGTALHAAARTNRGAIVLALLEAGADPTVKSPSGATFQDYYFSYPRTVLSEQALAERQKIVAWLDAHDVDVNPEAR